MTTTKEYTTYITNATNECFVLYRSYTCNIIRSNRCRHKMHAHNIPFNLYIYTHTHTLILTSNINKKKKKTQTLTTNHVYMYTQKQTVVRKVIATLNANGNVILQCATKYANQSVNNQDAPPDAKS